MYISESEGSKFWLSVLTDLQQRGVKDILIASIDKMGGFEKTIYGIFPKTEFQSYIVHQMRNTIKYVASKVTKEGHQRSGERCTMIYRASNKESAEQFLDDIEKKWGKKYPIVIRSWRANCHAEYIL